MTGTFNYECRVCYGTLTVERGPGEPETGLEARLECPGCGGRMCRRYAAVPAKEGVH